MYQYRGYVIQHTNSGEVHVRNSSGTFLRSFENDTEASEYIDDILDGTPLLTEDKSDPVDYYVCRINRRDRDTYNNYQYYNGKMFKYNAYNIKYMTKSSAESVKRRYMQKHEEYIYYIKRKGER